MGFNSRFFERAPAFPGAFSFLALALLSACDQKSGTPSWQESSSPPPAAVPAIPASLSPKDIAPPPAEASGLRFVSYNVENWLTMEGANGKPGTPKPEAAKSSIVSIVSNEKPDVLGLCEIGTREDLVELQARLKAAGTDLPHIVHTGGADPVRHLALLSRFPVTSMDQPRETGYRLRNRTFSIQRGILDATLSVGGTPYRFLGVHLKSKRPVPEGDQEAMRGHEAELVRRHLDQLLASDPGARLVVYGDFNDTKASSTLRAITGPASQPDSLFPLPLADSRGERWTQHWAEEDLYSRFDWILVSPVLRPEVDSSRCRVIDDPAWAKASDHRPLLMVLK